MNRRGMFAWLAGGIAWLVAGTPKTQAAQKGFALDIAKLPGYQPGTEQLLGIDCNGQWKLFSIGSPFDAPGKIVKA